jgi:flagellin-like hook-associated protein FlgL
MVGVPVTVTTTSAGAAVLSTSATLYTGSAGTVAPSVYAWTSGAKTFTVTAGTVTSTETVNYRQADAAEVRSISVAADGNRHLVTAKDRFGNVVPGVRIYGTRTGNGTFGGGSPTANAITAAPTVVDSNTGVAEFIFNAGSSDSVVKYQVASAADTPSATYGYTDALKGNVDGGTTPEALTPTAAGTIYLDEEGVGASFDAAGVNSVTAAIAAGTDTAQTAADAAAEATDAANAATDAANAAAEAADAATAAAQDAADAVAALSAQVASLISGLKSQLTALTNLVIKIQKKVKA